MADPRDVLAQRVSAALGAAFGPEYAAADPVIRPSSFADYQSNAALPLARKLGRSPRDIAADIIGHLDLDGVAEPPEVSGPGFINLRLLPGWIAAEATSELRAPAARGGAARPGRSWSWWITPGPTWPRNSTSATSGPRWSVTPSSGSSSHLGHTVIRAAHLGDWGTPFGMLIEHALDIGEDATRKQLATGEFTAFYQAARGEFDSEPGFADRARRRVALLQGGEPESRRLWQVLVSASMEYLIAIYRRLGITLTEADMAPESFYNPMLADVCAELEAAGIAVISDGALCAFPAGFTGRDGAPLPLMLRKSDGGYGYDTTDAAAIRYRLVDLHVQRIIYVVGSEQSQHLQMIFELAREAGWLTDGHQRGARRDRPGHGRGREAAEDQDRRAGEAGHADRRGGRARRPGHRGPL